MARRALVTKGFLRPPSFGVLPQRRTYVYAAAIYIGGAQEALSVRSLWGAL